MLQSEYVAIGERLNYPQFSFSYKDSSATQKDTRRERLRTAQMRGDEVVGIALEAARMLEVKVSA